MTQERHLLDEALKAMTQAAKQPLKPGTPEWEAAYEIAASAFPREQEREKLAEHLQEHLGIKIPVCRNTKLAIDCKKYPTRGGKCDLCHRVLKV